jgi:hypothetical protein
VALPGADGYEVLVASSQQIACGAGNLHLPADSVAVLRNRNMSKSP